MTAWGQALSKFWDVSLFFDAQPLKLVGEASCCQRTGTHWRPDAYSRLRTKITSYFPKSFSTITPDCSFCNTATACCHNCSPLWDFRFLVKCDWFCTWLPVVSWLQKETLGVPAEQMSCFVGGISAVKHKCRFLQLWGKLEEKLFAVCSSLASMCWCIWKLVMENVEFIWLRVMWIHDTACMQLQPGMQIDFYTKPLLTRSLRGWSRAPWS